MCLVFRRVGGGRIISVSVWLHVELAEDEDEWWMVEPRKEFNQEYSCMLMESQWAGYFCPQLVRVVAHARRHGLAGTPSSYCLAVVSLLPLAWMFSTTSVGPLQMKSRVY